MLAKAGFLWESMRRVVEAVVSAHLLSCGEDLVAFEGLYGQVYV